MLLPYRAKNRPEHFPYVTVGLIVINVLVFFLTTKNFFSIDPRVVEQWAAVTGDPDPLRMFTAMFLHADLFHLGFNMLALFIFGAAAEGRMRPWFFLPFYLISGFAGDFAHEIFFHASAYGQYSLGASGAIMGTAGMYLWMFPFSYIVALHREYWIMGWLTSSDIQARWIIASYIGIDLFYQILLQGKDGVGHMAHLGGFAAGLILTAICRIHRDSEDVSDAKAIHADAKDYSLLSYRDLAAIMQNPTDDPNLVLAYCSKCIGVTNEARIPECLATVEKYMQLLMEKGDAGQFAWVVLSIPAQYGGIHAACYLRLASKMECIASNDYACSLYRRIYELYPMSMEAESALMRLARINERIYGNYQAAEWCYAEILRLHPNSQSALDLRARRR